MKLQLKNPIVFFDLETTGTNIVSDRIVEIAYHKVSPNGREETKSMRINPEMHIPESSSAIHGIYDADVVDCPTFKAVAKEIVRDIEGCDLGGYNSNRFDIPLLAERLIAVTDWTVRENAIKDLSIGYFGASTGAAAALVAAARVPEVSAVVSRGGRPDLAGPALGTVRAPTLLIVGGNDSEVLALNRAALMQMNCEATLAIIPGATHLFVEPGALERVASLAADWFEEHLAASRTASADRSA